MTKRIEVTAKTVDEAVEKALKEFNTTRENVDVYVVEEGSKGIFGFGAKDAKVRVSFDEEKIENVKISITAEDITEAKKPTPMKKVEKSAPKKDEKKVETPVVEDEEESVKRPERKSTYSAEAVEQAIVFVQDVVTKMGTSCTVTAVDGEAKLIISGDEVGVVIGRRGDTIDAIQYLVNLHVNKDRHGDDYCRITVDTENYRARREETLKKLANSMANKAVKYRKDMSLEPMNPYERRIIHAALQNHKYVKTKSVGEEPNRIIVVTLKK
ncbi:MAG: protein jag [Clostridia bacterium]|nr:protein jag [Clostridia bacterium]